MNPIPDPIVRENDKRKVLPIIKDAFNLIQWTWIFEYCIKNHEDLYLLTLLVRIQNTLNTKWKLAAMEEITIFLDANLLEKYENDKSN